MKKILPTSTLLCLLILSSVNAQNTIDGCNNNFYAVNAGAENISELNNVAFGMNLRSLEKTEELTLYLIEQNKSLKEHRVANHKLSERITILE